MSTSNIFDLADTWNDAATTFTAIKMNVTDTASAAASNLLDLQVGGVSRFRVQKNGRVFFSPSASIHDVSGAGLDFFTGTDHRLRIRAGEFRLRFDTVFGFASGSPDVTGQDLSLFRDAADTLAQRRGTNPQAFRLYNTFTDASNFERGFMRWNSNVLEIGTEAGGTGGNRSLRLMFGNSLRASFDSVTTTINAGSAQILGLQPGALGVRRDDIIGFSNNATIPTATIDAGFVRQSSGVIRVRASAGETGELIFIVPTTDPAIAGALWNDGGTLSISAG